MCVTIPFIFGDPVGIQTHQKGFSWENNQPPIDLQKASLPETNISPENSPLESRRFRTWKRFHHFLGAFCMLASGSVFFHRSMEFPGSLDRWDRWYIYIYIYIYTHNHPILQPFSTYIPLINIYIYIYIYIVPPWVIFFFLSPTNPTC